MTTHTRVFDTARPLLVYWVCVKLVKLVEEYLRGLHDSVIDDIQVNNLKYHVCTLAIRLLLETVSPKARDLTESLIDRITPEFLGSCTNEVVKLFGELRGSDRKVTFDQVAKSPESTKKISEMVSDYVQRVHRSREQVAVTTQNP